MHLFRVSNLCPAPVLLWLLVTAVAEVSLQAQSATTSSSGLQTLSNLKTAFKTQINSQSLKLTDQYERALSRMESEVAESGDYEQALQIKNRRDQLQQILATDPSTGPTVLPLTPLAAKGSGISTGTDGSLAGWRLASSYAEWTLTKLVPGEYFLELDSLMSSMPSNTASTNGEPIEKALFEVFEVSLLAGAADNRRSFELNLGANKSAEYTPQRIGPMRFTRSPVTLRLVAAKSYATNIFNFKNIRLVSAPATLNEIESSPTPPTDIDVNTLRSALASALDSAYQPINKQYADRLKSLMSQFPDWQPLLENELRGIGMHKSSGSKPKDPLSLHLPKPLASLGGISGFQDLDNVTFVSHPENTGDRFRVSHEGKEFFVRLLWLRCASPSDGPTSVSSDDTFNDHFGITKEDATLFGRAALQFTSGYLSGRSFRLLARNSSDPDETLPALLFLPDIGLFHNLLIDQGLAAVVGKPGNGGTLERALQHSILDREKEARSRNPRPGAWALAPIETGEPKNP